MSDSRPAVTCTRVALLTLLLTALLTGAVPAAPHLRELRTFQVASDASLLLGPQGRYLVVGDDQALRVFEAGSGKTVLTLPGSRGYDRLSDRQRNLCAFSADGQFFAVVAPPSAGAKSGQLRLLEVKGWRERWKASVAMEPDPPFPSLTFDGTFVAAGASVFRCEDGAEVALKLESPGSAGVASARGHRLLVCSDKRAQRVDLDRGAAVGAGIGLHSESPSTCQLSPDGETVLVASKGVLEIHPGSGQAATVKVGGRILDASFSPDGLAVALHWTPGGELQPQRSRVYSLAGKALSPAYDQGYSLAADATPVCPGPAWFGSWLALATPNSLALLGKDYRAARTFKHPPWAGHMAVAQCGKESLLVTVSLDARTQETPNPRYTLYLFGPKGQLASLALKVGMFPTSAVAQGPTVLVSGTGTSTAGLYRVEP